MGQVAGSSQKLIGINMIHIPEKLLGSICRSCPPSERTCEYSKQAAAGEDPNHHLVPSAIGRLLALAVPRPCFTVGSAAITTII